MEKFKSIIIRGLVAIVFISIVYFGINSNIYTYCEEAAIELEEKGWMAKPNFMK